MSKSEAVFNTLRERIVSGRYSSGHSLRISDAAKEFGVSAGPVREALRRLEGHGLVRHQANVGAQVLGMDEVVFKETLEVMAALEGLASALAAPLLTEADLDALRDLNQRMAESSEQGDMQTFGDLNRSFHQLLCGPCPNNYLLSQIGVCWDRVAVAQIFVRIPLRHRQSLAEHDQLIGLIEAGADPSQIEEFVRAHKRRTLLDLNERAHNEREVA